MGSVIDSLDSCGWSEFVREPVILKKKNPQTLVHPIFNRCLKYIDSSDSVWTNLFKQASKGKFPRKFSYEPETNTLHYNRFKYRDKIILSKDELEATKQITDFFKKNGRIYSKKDCQNSKPSQDNSNLSWTGLNESIKSYLISDYVRELCKKYSLDPNQDHVILKMKIDHGLLEGKITSSNIIFNKHKIVKITNLKWNSRRKYFYIEGSGSNLPQNRNVLQDNWILPDDQYQVLVTPYIPTRSMFGRCTNRFMTPVLSNGGNESEQDEDSDSPSQRN